MKKWIASLLLLWPVLVLAEPVVVVAADSPLTALSQSDVRQLFNGHTRRLQGQVLSPLDLPASSATRRAFYLALMGKTPEQMKSYWARMIFTGRGMPPRQVSGDREMQLLVSSNRNFIGYLDDSRVTAKLKVVFRP
ncbi:hypothetical protein A11A3_02722 [Alcanivorax hongdengensis A-11-3]|uniref:Phosphate ABC transporter periplasmic protein n=1 Tax=Alcanivorax hongdengensis A-11-3 TaxID=1177179 RepID=L0WHV9_9GAMM|nr:hypothetical protein [Alcanivorax hongdengensis]EKF75747.1 hypothetical protein A11A3_02722 [Alcanivorax hongdengensis A-11-3]